MIPVEVPREMSFHLPEGRYAATLTQTRKIWKQTSRGSQDWIRFLFEVDIPGQTRFINMAGRSFALQLKPGSDLRNFLEPLVGLRFFLDRSGQTIDLQELEGTKCEVELVHICGKDYDQPLVLVQRVAKPGTMRLTEGGKD